MTTAHAGIQIQPSNYYYFDQSTETLSQVNINSCKPKSNCTVVDTFGQEQAICSVNLAKDAPDLYRYEKQAGYGYY